MLQVELPDAAEVQAQAVAAGYANVDEYLLSLLDRDKERLAVRSGVDAMRAGRTRPFAEFDAELRREHGIERER
ncbi:MAG: hypothetical protein WD066_00115 [Planctomycetaceae bacterium]